MVQGKQNHKKMSHNFDQILAKGGGGNLEEWNYYGSGKDEA